MKRIGIFGGTFDPIHFGHINLAIELSEKHKLDEVWFIPVLVSPHKTEEPPTSFDHRQKMLELSLKEIPHFKVKDIERQLPSPSFTIHTLQALFDEQRKKKDEIQFFLILGEDAIPNFCRWHEPDQIIQMVPLLIGSRNSQKQELELSKTIKEACQKGLTNTLRMDISATEIRKRLKNGLYCGHLVPNAALKYIQKENMYKNQ